MRPRKLAVVAAAAVALSALCGCACDRDMQTRIKQMARTQGPAEDYRVAPPDEFAIEVRGEPELSRTVIVRPDGKVTVPTVGDMYVQGKTIAEVDAEITEALSKELAAPNVTVTLLAARSKAIYVLGEVRRPGMQPYFGDMTLMDALGSAGGLSLYANAGAVRLTRPALDDPDVYDVNVRYLVYKGEAAYNLVLAEGDIIYVPPTPFAKVGYAMDQLLFPFRAVLGGLITYGSVNEALDEDNN